MINRLWKGKRGSALLIVLGLLVLLLVLAIALVSVVDLDYAASRSYSDNVEAGQLARAVLNVAVNYGNLADPSGTDVDLDNDGTKESKWSYNGAGEFVALGLLPPETTSGHLFRYAYLITDFTSRASINALGNVSDGGAQGINDGYTTSEISLVQYLVNLGIPVASATTIANDIIATRNGADGAPGDVSVDDDPGKITSPATDFIDNDGDGLYDEDNVIIPDSNGNPEGIDEPGEFYPYNPLGTSPGGIDIPFGDTDQIDLLTGVGGSTIRLIFENAGVTFDTYRDRLTVSSPSTIMNEMTNQPRQGVNYLLGPIAAGNLTAMNIFQSTLKNALVAGGASGTAVSTKRQPIQIVANLKDFMDADNEVTAIPVTNNDEIALDFATNPGNVNPTRYVYGIDRHPFINELYLFNRSTNGVDDDGDWNAATDDLNLNGIPDDDWDGPGADANGDGNSSYDPEPNVDEANETDIYYVELYNMYQDIDLNGDGTAGDPTVDGESGDIDIGDWQIVVGGNIVTIPAGTIMPASTFYVISSDSNFGGHYSDPALQFDNDSIVELRRPVVLPHDGSTVYVTVDKQACQYDDGVNPAVRVLIDDVATPGTTASRTMSVERTDPRLAMIAQCISANEQTVSANSIPGGNGAGGPPSPAPIVAGALNSTFALENRYEYKLPNTPLMRFANLAALGDIMCVGYTDEGNDLGPQDDFAYTSLVPDYLNDRWTDSGHPLYKTIYDQLQPTAKLFDIVGMQTDTEPNKYIWEYFTVIDPLHNNMDDDGDGLIDEGDEIIVEGRVNLNTASTQLLQALPYSDGTFASNVITRRGDAGGYPTTPFTTLADVLDLVDPAVPTPLILANGANSGSDDGDPYIDEIDETNKYIGAIMNLVTVEYEKTSTPSDKSNLYAIYVMVEIGDVDNDGGTGDGIVNGPGDNLVNGADNIVSVKKLYAIVQNFPGQPIKILKISELTSD